MTKAIGVCLTWLLIFNSSFSHAQDGELVTIALTNARPVEAFILELTRKYPVFVTYEDPRYEYSDDLRDATDEVWNALVPNPGVRVLFPVEQEIALGFNVRSGDVLDLGNILDQLVDIHNQKGRGGRFRIERSGELFHVIPMMTRNEAGTWVEHIPPLDSAITISPEYADGLRALQLVTEAVKKKTGAEVLLGVLPVPLLKRHARIVEAQNEPAREILSELVASIEVPFTWTFEYEPVGRTYVLGLHRIAPELRSIAPPLRSPSPMTGSGQNGDFRKSPFLTPERKRQLELELAQ